MSDSEIAKIERDAALKADEAGGEYLLSIGKFDIRDLSEQELTRFWVKGIAAANKYRSDEVLRVVTAP